MNGLSGIEFKILEMSCEPTGYYVTIDGPWWMKLLYDLGILQIYIERMINAGLISETRIGTNYISTSKGFWTRYDYDIMELGNH